MPAGDAQRTWFPELIAALRQEWQEAMSFTDLIELRGRLDATLQAIRSDRNLHPPVMKCPRCGARGLTINPHVSVRAMILALARFGIASPEQVSRPDRAWAKHRKQNGLDLYGRKV